MVSADCVFLPQVSGGCNESSCLWQYNAGALVYGKILFRADDEWSLDYAVATSWLNCYGGSCSAYAIMFRQIVSVYLRHDWRVVIDVNGIVPPLSERINEVFA